MMRMPSEKYLEYLRSAYPVGCRVRLVHMDDVQAPPAGTEGTVIGVDDMGSVMIRWDNGSGLNAVPDGGDTIEKISAVKTICYGQEQIWKSRREAEDYFQNAMIGSEGSERDRYINVYTKLISGMEVCSDD